MTSCNNLNEVFWFKHTEYTYQIIYTYIHIFHLFFRQQGIPRNTGASIILGPPLQGETCAFRQNPARDRGCPSSTPPFRTDLNMGRKFQTTHGNGHGTFPTKPRMDIASDVFPYQTAQKIELAHANLPRKWLRNRAYAPRGSLQTLAPPLRSALSGRAKGHE